MKGGRKTAPLSLTDTFEEQCPIYVSFGMTPQEYWDGDPGLARWYREAQRLKNEQANREAWLNGLYIYTAICDAHPLFNPYAKRAKARPYPEKPYELFAPAKSIRERREDEARAKAANGFAAWVNKFNERMRKRGERE